MVSMGPRSHGPTKPWTRRHAKTPSEGHCAKALALSPRCATPLHAARCARSMRWLMTAEPDTQRGLRLRTARIEREIEGSGYEAARAKSPRPAPRPTRALLVLLEL